MSIDKTPFPFSLEELELLTEEGCMILATTIALRAAAFWANERLAEDYLRVFTGVGLRGAADALWTSVRTLKDLGFESNKLLAVATAVYAKVLPASVFQRTFLLAQYTKNAVFDHYQESAKRKLAQPITCSLDKAIIEAEPYSAAIRELSRQREDYEEALRTHRRTE